MEARREGRHVWAPALTCGLLLNCSIAQIRLSLAGTDLVRVGGTEEINDEWTRNLKANRPELSAEKIDRTRLHVNKSVPDCLISGFESLIPSLNLPDSDDRHVLNEWRTAHFRRHWDGQRFAFQGLTVAPKKRCACPRRLNFCRMLAEVSNDPNSRGGRRCRRSCRLAR
jgi:hypothetical protein